MNIVNFDQTGGFPLEAETLKRLQSAFLTMQQLGFLAGNKAIISGCNVSGSNTSDGYIFLNGELLFFKGGVTQSKIIIQEVVDKAEYEDGNEKDTYHTRTACFGTGVEQHDWSEFKRMYPITSALYLDKIDMYAGDTNNLPAGWFLCDGQNGTVDLRSRFIVGYNPDEAAYDAIGKTGGEAQVTLTESQMPRHKHNATVQSPAEGGSSGSDVHFNIDGYNRQNFSKTVDVEYSGGDQSHENRPPYYTLAFIQFKGV